MLLQSSQKLGLFGSATPCASPIPWPSIFSDYSFCVHHTFNWDDRHLLAHTMASNFSVAWQFSQRKQLFFHNGLKNSMPFSD
jgi:hypothetical protein